jgi:hypothetical protein
MSQPNQYPPQGQPGWGQQPPPPPGWGTPQPPPPQKNNAGKIVGLSCLGIIGLVIVLGIIGAALGGTDDTSSGKSDKTVTADDKPKEEPAAEKPEPEPEQQAPVKVTAKKTDFAKSVLADSSDYTSVKVTVTNDSDETISVNPLYFAITDTDGTKHAHELAADENQLDTVKLAPGENTSGVVTGKGTFEPKYVTYTDGLFSDPLRADVS